MVTIFHTERNELKDNESYILTELRGLSTDEKPTKIEENNIGNGSVFIEIDTQKIYIYDSATNEWVNPEDTSENTEENTGD